MDYLPKSYYLGTNKYFFDVFQVLDDLIVALKIVTTPNSKSTDENKENIQGQERGSIPMDVSESSASQATETSTKGESGANPNAAEAEMDVDCSISEND